MNWDEPTHSQDDPDLPEPEAAVPGVPAGRFAERNVLGAGASGRIVRAVDQRLARDVALKIVPGDQPRARARLRREAAVLARLEHPGIVPIYDVLERPDGGLQLALRIVRGRTLEAILADPRPNDPRALARLLVDAADAVGHAHAQGFVHRDLKPANIMVGEHGETQVIDWGLAAAVDAPRSADDEDDGGPSPLDAMITRAGTVLGTPAYMAPEQAHGARVGPRADVWSLGAILFELVQRRPLVATRGSLASAEVVLDALRAGRVPTADSLTGLPRDLGPVIRRALALDPAARHADASAFASALRAALGAPARRLRRLLLAAALVAASVLAVVALASDTTPLPDIITTRADAGRDQALAEVTAQQAARLLDDGQAPDAVALALRSLALTPTPAAYGVMAGAGLARAPRLVHAAPISPCGGVAIAPDGVRWLCWTERAVSLLDGDRLVWSARASVTVGAAFIGADVVSGDSRELRVHAMADGAVRAVAPLDIVASGRIEPGAARGHGLIHNGATALVFDAALTQVARVDDSLVGVLRPDDTVAALRRTGELAVHRSEGTLATSVVTQLGGRAATVDVMAALPHGYALGTMHGALVIIGDDGAIEAELQLDPPAVIRRLAVAPSGRRLAVVAEGSGPLVVDLQGHVLVRLPKADAGAVAFIDDDQLVTIAQRRALWRLPRDAHGPLPRLSDLTSLASDGERLVVTHGSSVSLITLATAALRTVPLGPSTAMSAAIAPGDGARMLAVAFAGHQRGITRLDSDSGALLPRPVGPYDGMARRVAYTPSGALLALVYAPPYVAPPTAANEAPRFEPKLDQQFSEVAVGGGVIALLARHTDDLVLAAADPALHEIGRCQAGPSSAVALAPDGETLYLAQRDAVLALDVTSCALVGLFPRGAGDGFGVVAASSDGAWVAAGTTDGEVRVWSSDGALVAQSVLHGERVAALVFDPAVRWLMIGTLGGVLRQLDLDVLRSAPATLAAEVRGAWGLE